MLQPIFMQLALKRSLSTFVGVVHCRASALSQLVEPLNSPQQQLNGPPENGAAPGQLSPAHTAHSGAAFATLRAPGHGAWARPAVNRGVVAPSLMMRHASLGAHRYGTLVAFPLAQTGEGISEWWVHAGMRAFNCATCPCHALLSGSNPVIQTCQAQLPRLSPLSIPSCTRIYAYCCTQHTSSA